MKLDDLKNIPWAKEWQHDAVPVAMAEVLYFCEYDVSPGKPARKLVFPFSRLHTKYAGSMLGVGWVINQNNGRIVHMNSIQEEELLEYQVISEGDNKDIDHLPVLNPHDAEEHPIFYSGNNLQAVESALVLYHPIKVVKGKIYGLMEIDRTSIHKAGFYVAGISKDINTSRARLVGSFSLSNADNTLRCPAFNDMKNIVGYAPIRKI